MKNFKGLIIALIVVLAGGFIVFAANKYWNNEKIIKANMEEARQQSIDIEKKKRENSIDDKKNQSDTENSENEDNDSKNGDGVSVLKNGKTSGADENSSEGRKKPAVNGKVVVIDAGHQQAPITQQEPIGPGASQTKPMLSSGTEGTVTKVPEYQLTLDVSKKLRDELENRGYKVVMIRETNDCPISNKGRADIANKNGGIFLRIHANSANESGVRGALTMCPADDNPYTPNIINDSYRLSKFILDDMCSETGSKNRGVMKTNSMSGINWSKVPVTIIEMGFMSNPDEDRLMQQEEYQNKIARGIANGVDQYYR